MRQHLPALLLVAVACAPSMPGPDAGSPSHDGGPSFSCPTGLTECSSACRDLSRDNSNCGTCGTLCTAAYTCTGGRCTALCDPGLKYCSGSCVDTLNDPMSCGACGRVCPASTLCRMGSCECPAPTLQRMCGGTCKNVANDANNCGDCGVTCDADAGQTCSGSQCWVACSGGTTRCGTAPGTCHDLMNESTDCGMCGRACAGGLVCSGGNCVCPANQTNCSNHCTNLLADPQNCGGCGISCNGQPCFQGTCLSPCPPGQTRCGQVCVDLMNDVANCNACGHGCTGATTCSGGQCVACNSATTDCDGDGWLASEGDCCDTPANCSAPADVNPGAVEVDSNGVDDNCNGLLDSADVLDVRACDQMLTQGSGAAADCALAMELCRTTVENPATPQQRTWGVISADLLRADGSPLTFAGAASIRSSFGVLSPQAGGRFGVFSTGLAADATQTNPGPNGGPAFDPSESHGSLGQDSVDFSTCTSPLCIKDWFNASRPPLKMPKLLPEAPMCGGQTMAPYEANDSVMLRLRMRAPTNARAFQFSALFMSSEYPEYVCSAFNDQLIALVDTASHPAVSNPSDKNLMTYVKGGLPWPVGINVAAGTDLFARCKPIATDPCWASVVDPQSCSLGDSSLSGTGFDAPMGAMSCTTGGGTRWLTTSGNVVPGQIVELRIAIWDVDDDQLDSLVLLDAFKWLKAPAAAGTE